MKLLRSVQLEGAMVTTVGLLLLALSLAPETSSLHVRADPWLAVALVAIGAGLQAICIWRSSFEDDA